MNIKAKIEQLNQEGSITFKNISRPWKIVINAKEKKNKDGTITIYYDKSYNFSTEEDALKAIDMLEECRYGLKTIRLAKVVEQPKEMDTNENI